jgi:transcriptional antiterminator
MSTIEIKVLNAIKNSASFDLPIQARELRHSLGLSKRTLEEIIESLRVNFRQPIVAKKKRPSGYYLPKTEEERQTGLALYKRQILTEQKNLAAIMSVNLKEYWEEQDG